MAHLDDVIPPKGCSFVAYGAEGALLGMVFLRPSGEGGVEIKRLYVRPEGRGTGAGKALVDHAVDAAREMGMQRVYLDSTRNLVSALSLYEKRGFRYIDSFPGSDHVDDAELAPYMVYMVKELQ